MSSKLDMPLGDIISSDRSEGRRGGRGGSRGRGGRRGGAGRGRGGRQRAQGDYVNPLSRDDGDDGEGGYAPQRRQREDRSAPYSRPAAAPAERKVASSGKVLVSNLDSSVTNEDIQGIFAEIGEINKVTINYDGTGRHLGTAEITFANRRDAAKAVVEFDGAEVDDRPMYLKLIGTDGKVINPSAPTGPVVNKPAPQVPQGKAALFGSAMYDNSEFRPRRGRGRGRTVQTRGGRGGGGSRGGNNNANGGNRGGRGGSRGGRRENSKPASAADLDAEMDAYFNKDSSAASAAASAE